MPGPNGELLPGELDPATGQPVPDPNAPTDPPVDPVTPVDPPVDPPAPVDPPVDPVDPPAPATHTIGDDIKAVKEDTDTASSDQSALEAYKAEAAAKIKELEDKAKASADKVISDKAALAADLPKVGGSGSFELNPDGTATAYYTSATSPDGYYTEILKPVDTVVPA